MKISKERLRQIIKEEVSKAVEADRVMKPDVWETLDAQQWIDHGPDEEDLLSGRSPVEYGGYYENARNKEEWRSTLQDAIDNYGKHYAKGETLDSPEAAQEAFYEATKEIDGRRRDDETMGYSDEQIEDMYYFDDDMKLQESHSKADEKTLKKMAKKLRSSSKMHGKQSKDLEGSSKLHADQADELEDIVDRSDDEELKEGDEPVKENLNCGCNQDPCITFGVISIEEARKIIQEEIQADLDEAKKKKTDKERMKCNSPRRIRKGEAGHGKKKFVVKACKDGKEKIIRYGDANMEIKKDSPERRKSFRARHGCDTKKGKDKMSARYWSCKKW